MLPPAHHSEPTCMPVLPPEGGLGPFPQLQSDRRAPNYSFYRDIVLCKTKLQEQKTAGVAEMLIHSLNQ